MAGRGEVRVAALWGPDHEALDSVAVEEVGPFLALALSRGRYAKGYPFIDLNEDGALAATDGVGSVLAVVDGHHGFEAARVALQVVWCQVPVLLTASAERVEAAVSDCLSLAAEAVATEVGGLEGARAASGTALSVAVVSGSRLTVGNAGDCIGLVVRGLRARRVGRDAPFLGLAVGPRALATKRAHLRPGDRVVVATDGMVDFLGRGWRRRLAGLAQGVGPVDLARSAVEAACRGGAGDNIAVVAAEVGAGHPGQPGLGGP